MSAVKAMPKITQQEKDFLREYMAGVSIQEAWTHIFDPDLKMGTDEAAGKKRYTRARALLKRRSMQMWLKYLKTASVDQIMQDLYVGEIAFGGVESSLKAADKYMQSQFAGKDGAGIFLHWLREALAEVVIQCDGREERVRL